MANEQMVKAYSAHLEKMSEQFQKVLPKGQTAERFNRIVLTALQNNQALYGCELKTVLGAAMSAAQLGLEPDPFLGECYLVPYAGKAQLIPGYKGYIKLAKNDPEVAEVYSEAVYKNDVFKFIAGTERKIIHEPQVFGDRGELIGFYAVCKYRSGNFECEVMSRQQVDEIKKAALAKQRDATKKDLPWNAHYVEMGRKTCIRRLAKYMPKSVQKLAAYDGAVEGGQRVSFNDSGDIVVDVEATEASYNETPTPKASARLDSLINKQAKGEQADGVEAFVDGGEAQGTGSDETGGSGGGQTSLPVS